MDVDYLRDERAVKVRLRGIREGVIQQMPALPFVPSIDHIVATTTISGRVMNNRPDVINSAPEGEFLGTPDRGAISRGGHRGVLAIDVEDEEGR